MEHIQRALCSHIWIPRLLEKWSAIVGGSLYQAARVCEGLDLCDVRMCHRKRTISVWRSAADPVKTRGQVFGMAALPQQCWDNHFWIMRILCLISALSMSNVADEWAAFAKYGILFLNDALAF